MSVMRASRYRLPRDITVSALLAEYAQGPAFVRYLWEPLCVAALNTPPQRASGQMFLNVLRDGLDAGRKSAEILLARVDLSTLFPEPAASYVRARGGDVRTGVMVSGIRHDGDGIEIGNRDERQRYDQVICAVSPHRAAPLLSELDGMGDTIATVQRFRYQPICTVFLQFSEPLKVPSAMLGTSGTAQWIFDRAAIAGQSGLVAAVISAEGAHQALTLDELAKHVHAELEAELGPLPPLAWHKAIAEKRATFECSVNLRRPSTRTALANVHLAGDYTASDYPATIEAAVRSGIAAAKQVLAQSDAART
jgi:squalene-associated FAD-dependent desaturase